MLVASKERSGIRENLPTKNFCRSPQKIGDAFSLHRDHLNGIVFSQITQILLCPILFNYFQTR